MAMDLKKWAGLGVSTALLGAGLTACAPAEQSNSILDPDADPAAVGELGEGEGEGGEGEAGEGEGEGGEGEGGEAGHAMDTLPLEKRLAFMTGHVKAGLALYRAGDPEAAAPHLLHPVSETHADEREGLDALGFDASIFETVSTALENNQPAEEIEPQLAAAEENLAMLAEQAGGDPADIIQYLMDTIVVEYTVAITDGAVSDPGEYQDAYGFAIVARDQAEMMNLESSDLIDQIDALIALWPDAPIPPETPSPLGQVIAQTSRVTLALP
ncbi:MAG: hypothetical protein AAF719_00400 [Pseudomonadota bacterium]